MRTNSIFLLSSVAAGLVCGGWSTAAYAGLDINPYPNRTKAVVINPEPMKVEMRTQDAASPAVQKTAPPKVSPSVVELPVPKVQMNESVEMQNAAKAPPLEVSTSARFLETPVPMISAAPTPPKAMPVQQSVPVNVRPFSQKEKEALKAELREEIKRELRAELASTAVAEQDPIPLAYTPAPSPSFEPEPDTILERNVIHPIHNLMESLTSPKDEYNPKPVMNIEQGAKNSTQMQVSKDMQTPDVINPAAGSGQIDSRALQNRGLVAIQVPAQPMSKTQAVFGAPSGASGWTVIQGQDLRDTLGQWSQQAGVEMIWSVPHAYDVPQTSAVNGSYEQAVQALLEQYSLTDNRPLGSLHVDPQTGKRTLVIEVQG